VNNLDNLDQAITTYHDALDALQQGGANASSKVMDVLIARDRVARALSNGENIPTLALFRIAELDQKLKDEAANIDAVAGGKTLAGWRQSIHPLNTPWWWSLDERVAAAAQPSPLWTIPAALFFTLSISVLAETITTLRNGGINALSVFGTLMQTLLALLAGSAFLSGGREWLENLFSQLGINRKFRGASRVWLAAGVLLFTFVIRSGLPDGVARYRNYQGNQSLANKQYFSAVQEYQQATALKPDFIEAQYNLAVAYDKSRDLPRALSQYELSINSDPKNYAAYNNLARLYILQNKDYNGALRRLTFLVNNFQELSQNNRYHLFKNRGWANLELSNYGQAAADLEWALQQRDGAAAHYLWGRVFEEQPSKNDQERQSNIEKSRQQWNSFITAIQHNPDQEEVEPNWIAHAQEQLGKVVENEKTNP
jgi:tetratricopeptide (TPR) repeat protein